MLTYLRRGDNYTVARNRHVAANQNVLEDFVRNAPLNDIDASDRFIREHPEVIEASDDSLERYYIDKAVQALAKGDDVSKISAATYIEKYSLIRLLKADRGKDPLGLLMDKDRNMTLKFQQTFARVRGECEDKLKARRRGNGGTVARHNSGGSGVTGLTNKLGSLQLYKQRFQRLVAGEWHWFKPGRVFAMRFFKEYNNDQSSQYSEERLRSTRGTEVTEKIRRMVVVRVGEAFCLAIPIKTYGNQGLKKVGLRENNINAHARIHMADQEPTWLDREPRTPKRDIAVQPADRYQTLLPASRVCFERTESIDYNDPIMKIGTVTPESLPYLRTYWGEEINRAGTQGRARPRASSGQLPVPEESRHDPVSQEETHRIPQRLDVARHTSQSQVETREPTQTQERSHQPAQTHDRSRHTDSGRHKKHSNDKSRGWRR